MANEEGELQPIIVKKIKKGGGHHGGAWKVAYADFVTAMMAFFLLLWLLNVTTDEQKNAISNYFDPTAAKVSESTSGAGGVLGGLSVAPQGAMVTTIQSITSPTPAGSAVNNSSAQKSSTDNATEHKSQKQKAIEEAKKEFEEAEKKRLEEAKKELEKAINESPDLKELKENLIIEITPEGLRIQVIDKEKKPMFATGSARMFPKTQQLLQLVGEIIVKQPNHISIRGHTDSVPYGSGAKYTNWELSADRANSSRRVLVDGGFPQPRVHDVMGKADTEHLFPDEPERAGNRRISILLLKEELTNPEYSKKIEEKAQEIIAKQAPPTQLPIEENQAPTPDAIEAEGQTQQQAPSPFIPKIGTFKRSQGAVEFP
mgnify:CR=1 FL=1